MTAATIDSRGRSASRPTEVPARGWKDIFSRVRVEMKRDNVTLLSAGVAFYSLLALVPAMIAGLSIYGLVADPSEVEGQVLDALKAAPQEVRDMIASQLQSIAGDAGAAVLATIIGAAVALWSASNGVANLITAINIAYDEQETRGFLKRKALAIGFTLGAILFIAVAFTLIALLPPLLAEAGLGPVGRWIAGGVRWVVLLGGMIFALALLYRFGPDRKNPKWRWVSPGALLAALLWVVTSVGFSIYTANFGKYNETYGSLGAVVVVMLWLWLTALSIVAGAELNAELERQTFADTTEGQPKPLGARGAYAADTVGETAEDVKAAKDRGEPMGGGKDPGETAQPGQVATDAVPDGSFGPDRTPRGPQPQRVPAGVATRTVSSGQRETAPSPGALPAFAGLSILGVAMKLLRGVLERKAPSRG